jgi:AraC family transcriptional regulator of adaptative response/methylated-DNA-[protein]-cysteine methyltransferase
MSEQIIWQVLNTPLGEMFGGVTNKGCCLLEFIDRRSINSILQNLQKKYKKTLIHGASKLLDQLQEEISSYFFGELFQFSIPVDVKGTPFQISVWQELLKIPYGETRSYHEIAISIQKPSAVRAVGNANGNNNIGIIIPCHRVIGSNGELTGYGGKLWRKKKLLDLEFANKVKFGSLTDLRGRGVLSPQLTLDKWINESH